MRLRDGFAVERLALKRAAKRWLAVGALCAAASLVVACQVSPESPVGVSEYGHWHVTDNGVTVVTLSVAIDGDSSTDETTHELEVTAHIDRAGAARPWPQLTVLRSFDGLSGEPDSNCATDPGEVVLRCRVSQPRGTSGCCPVRQHVQLQYRFTGRPTIESLRVEVTDLSETNSAGKHPSWNLLTSRSETSDLFCAWG